MKKLKADAGKVHTNTPAEVAEAKHVWGRLIAYFKPRVRKAIEDRGGDFMGVEEYLPAATSIGYLRFLELAGNGVSPRDSLQQAASWAAEQVEGLARLRGRIRKPRQGKRWSGQRVSVD